MKHSPLGKYSYLRQSNHPLLYVQLLGRQKTRSRFLWTTHGRLATAIEHLFNHLSQVAYCHSTTMRPARTPSPTFFLQPCGCTGAGLIASGLCLSYRSGLCLYTAFTGVFGEPVRANASTFANISSTFSSINVSSSTTACGRSVVPGCARRPG